MKMIELMGKCRRTRLFLTMVLLSLLALTVTGAANDTATLEQINKTLVNVNETVGHINATATTPILPMKDATTIFITLVIIAILGGIIIWLVLPRSDKGKPMSSSEARYEFVGKAITVTFVFLLLLLAAILVKSLILSSGDVPMANLVWAAIIITAIVFLLLMFMGCVVDGTLDQGEMRRAIAGTFVVGFTMLIFFLAVYEIKNNEVVAAYLQMVGVIIGFYFGARTALMGTDTGTSEGLAIEFVEVDKDEKNIILTIRNKGDNKLVVDKVYVTGKDLTKYFEMSVTIDPKTSTKIDPLTLNSVLESGSLIKIKVVTSTGLSDEREHTWP